VHELWITGMKKRKTARHKSDFPPISLAPLDFETAIRAALQTGKAPPAPRPKKAKKRKAKK